jgi:hypothetical protein
MPGFRVVIVDETRGTLSEIDTPVQLDERPVRGDRISLPDGEEIVVRHVGSPRHDDVAGTIFGMTAVSPQRVS